MSKVKIGIIGGSGLKNPDILSNPKEIVVDTPYGPTSAPLVEGKISGVSCIILPRHGKGHTIMPGNINYRANIWALKEMGCTHVISSTATGSLQEYIKPGDVVILDNFIDRTKFRHQTFYDNGENSPKGLCHIPMEPAFCEKTRKAIIQAATGMGIRFHPTGTCVTIEGPRFSSKAESLLYQKYFNAHVVNMTTVPEVVLAKEAGLLYAVVALATDYDCWRSSGEKVNVLDVLKEFQKNVEKVKRLLVYAVEGIAKHDWTDTIKELENIIADSIMLPGH